MLPLKSSWVNLMLWSTALIWSLKASTCLHFNPSVIHIPEPMTRAVPQKDHSHGLHFFHMDVGHYRRHQWARGTAMSVCRYFILNEIRPCLDRGWAECKFGLGIVEIYKWVSCPGWQKEAAEKAHVYCKTCWRQCDFLGRHGFHCPSALYAADRQWPKTYNKSNPGAFVGQGRGNNGQLTLHISTILRIALDQTKSIKTHSWQWHEDSCWQSKIKEETQGFQCYPGWTFYLWWR